MPWELTCIGSGSISPDTAFPCEIKVALHEYIRNQVLSEGLQTGMQGTSIRLSDDDSI